MYASLSAGSGYVEAIPSLWWQKMKSLIKITRSSWLNSALRDNEAVYWVSIGHYEAVAVGN